MGILRNFINDNQFKAEELSTFKNKLFFEGDKRRVEFERFTILLFLSTAIATYGVMGDSVATVIGAMIIAPLMRPIMATAARVSHGGSEACRALLGDGRYQYCWRDRGGLAIGRVYGTETE